MSDGTIELPPEVMNALPGIMRFFTGNQPPPDGQPQQPQQPASIPKAPVVPSPVPQPVVNNVPPPMQPTSPAPWPNSAPMPTMPEGSRNLSPYENTQPTPEPKDGPWDKILTGLLRVAFPRHPEIAGMIDTPSNVAAREHQKRYTDQQEMIQQYNAERARESLKWGLPDAEAGAELARFKNYANGNNQKLMENSLKLWEQIYPNSKDLDQSKKQYEAMAKQLGYPVLDVGGNEEAGEGESDLIQQAVSNPLTAIPASMKSSGGGVETKNPRGGYFTPNLTKNKEQSGSTRVAAAWRMAHDQNIPFLAALKQINDVEYGSHQRKIPTSLLKERTKYETDAELYKGQALGQQALIKLKHINNAISDFQGKESQNMDEATAYAKAAAPAFTLSTAGTPPAAGGVTAPTPVAKPQGRLAKAWNDLTGAQPKVEIDLPDEIAPVVITVEEQKRAKMMIEEEGIDAAEAIQRVIEERE